MTLRDAMTTLFALGSLLVAADSCAAAPLAGARGGLRDRAAGYELTVLVDGVPVPTYFHDGETYVLGQLGARYTLRVANHSGRRIEAVVSVDGRDVTGAQAYLDQALTRVNEGTALVLGLKRGAVASVVAGKQP